MSDDGTETSTASYTINYHDTISESTCGNVNIPISSSLCVELTCRHAFEVSTSSCNSSAEVTIVAFATNAFGDGPFSMPVNINLKKTRNAQNYQNCSKLPTEFFLLHG